MRNEIALHDKETALKIANILVDEEYVVMISREEDLYIINYLCLLRSLAYQIPDTSIQ